MNYKRTFYLPNISLNYNYCKKLIFFFSYYLIITIFTTKDTINHKIFGRYLLFSA